MLWIGNASAKRTLSVLRRMRNYLRSTIIQNRTSNSITTLFET